MIRNVDPRCGFFPSLDPGSRSQKTLDPGCGSATLLPNMDTSCIGSGKKLGTVPGQVGRWMTIRDK